MMLYPEVQKRAQSELDEVVGRDRLPTFEDRDRLPYIANVVKETFRWKAVAPLGASHHSILNLCPRIKSTPSRCPARHD